MKQTYPLSALAHTRSGDKGSSVNVGVIAYTQKGYELLVNHLDTKKVADFFHTLTPRRVVRYELPNLLALNFILEGVLEGGGSLSLRIDAQGKAIGQAILELPLELNEEFN
jgi:hypothetical protein